MRELPPDGFIDGLMAIAEDNGPDAHVVIEILVAIDVPYPGALTAQEVFGRDAFGELRRPLGQGLRAGGDQTLRA